MRKVRALRPPVLVLDLNMPDGSALEVIPQLREETPETAIVVLTMQNDPAYAREALRSGAAGYVLKHSAGTEPPGDLCERETEVLRLIAMGHTNTEIASQLYLSVRTIETHRAHIQQKLRLSTRAELVRYALEHGLIET